MHPERQTSRVLAGVSTLLLAVALAMPIQARVHDPAPSPVPGLSAAMANASFWIERQPQSDTLLMDGAAIARQNARMRHDDPSIHAPLALPNGLKRETVTRWIRAVSTRPAQPRYTAGSAIDAATLDAWEDALALDAIPATVVPRFGLVVRRANLRGFPVSTRVHSAPDDTDIDRLQEDALFPGTPVAAVHTSRDGKWLFVVSERYRAWIQTEDVAIGQHDTVADYAARAHAGSVITDADAHTVHTPDAPALSRLQLDMGLRLPEAHPDPAVALHGQAPVFGRSIELPVRMSDGGLAFSAAQLPPATGIADAPLPFSRANLLRQAFRFLGERYGWGHDYNARDCSGFVSEVYRSLGILLPRNTGAQASSPALQRTELPASLSAAERQRRLQSTDVGDLLFMPGHVMMVIGHFDGTPWVIHDTAGMGMRSADGHVIEVPFNGVVITPLAAMFSDGVPVIDRITTLQRVR